MKIYIEPEKSTWNTLVERPVIDQSALEPLVQEICNQVAKGGDLALKALNEKFGSSSLSSLEVEKEHIQNADVALSPALKASIDQAFLNIKHFHALQREQLIELETMPGVRVWRKSVAIHKVGLYIPGGTAPLFSTVLMLGVPALLAGCSEIVLCSPANQSGALHPAILYAAKLCGISKIYKVGGAQAIAAMAFGTESIPKVYKIFGPGNQYVTAAKQYVSKLSTAIDMPAGPSEVAVVADDDANADWVAADLLSQAEHGADSQVLLVTQSVSKVEEVQKAISIQLDQLGRKDLAAAALLNSKAVVLQDKADVAELINLYAPEHLILQTSDLGYFESSIYNAGSIFMGSFTPESAGDYASGTNHTLPTNGWARAYSGVSLDSFVKKITYQKITKEGLEVLGPIVMEMAAAEGLDAHKNAVAIRLEK